MAVAAAAVTVASTATLLSVTETDYVGGAAYAVSVPSGGSTVYLCRSYKFNGKEYIYFILCPFVGIPSLL